MARYYEISAIPSGTGPPAQTYTWTSYPNGKNDPGALNVELDLFSSVYGVPAGDINTSTITIEGVTLAQLRQAPQFAGMSVVVRGGMQKGLPLANPAQAGLLLQGQIFQAFGNWVGTDMNINFVVVASNHTFSQPGNFVVNWQQGMSLKTAIANTLNVAFPGFKHIIQIDSSYAAPQKQVLAVYKTMDKFGAWLTSISGGKIRIGLRADGTVLVWDGPTKPTATPIAFTDLVGQPRWVEKYTMQFVTVMRADLQVGSYVTMPAGLQDRPGIVQTAASAQPSQLKYKTSFTGQFVVRAVRHVGNFRDPNGTSWVSVFEAYPET